MGALNASGTAVPFDLNNDGYAQNSNVSGPPLPTASGVIADDGKARQLLARYLYTLMMLLKDDEFQVYADVDGDGYAATGVTPLPPQAARDVAYYIAQWAVNIVDFRDSDATMTAFEFDIRPFTDDDLNTNNGTWDVDGIINTAGATTSPDDTLAYRGVVWGAERPELLITETIATHDRRTRDTAADPNSLYTTSSTPDKNYDQVRRPQGTLLIELFNPNSPLAIGNRIEGEAPSELHKGDGTDMSGRRCSVWT